MVPLPNIVLAYTVCHSVLVPAKDMVGRRSCSILGKVCRNVAWLPAGISSNFRTSSAAKSLVV